MSEYVTVPREPTDEMIRAGVAARWFVDNDEGKPANVRNSWEAMIAAAPPAASVRAKDVTNLEIATAFHEAYERLAPRYGYETRPESRKPFSDLPNELKLLMVAVVREVRTLLAPAVDERAASAEPEMCPNCVTPWKCNGPHEFPQAASSEAAVADQWEVEIMHNGSLGKSPPSESDAVTSGRDPTVDPQAGDMLGDCRLSGRLFKWRVLDRTPRTVTVHDGQFTLKLMITAFRNATEAAIVLRRG